MKKTKEETTQKSGPRAKKAVAESEVLAKIATMPPSDRALAERLHAIIKASPVIRIPLSFADPPHKESMSALVSCPSMVGTVFGHGASFTAEQG